MKNVNVDFKTTTIGDINRNVIYEYIINNPGKKFTDIQKNVYIKKPGKNELLNPSRQSLNENLNILLTDGRIMKHKRQYFARDVDDIAISRLAKTFKETLSFMFSPNLIDCAPKDDYKSRSLWISTPDLIQQNVRIIDNFYNIAKGLTTSPKIFQKELEKLEDKKRFTEEKSNERYLLEFSTRLGAYITFIFIKIMKLRLVNESNVNLNKKSLLKDKKINRRKKVLPQFFMEKAIDIKLLFHIFHALLYETKQIKSNYENKYDPNNIDSLFFDITDKEYNSLEETFRNVYPGLSEALEHYLNDRIKELTRNIDMIKAFGRTDHIDHKHDWQKMDLITRGYYVCMKCNLLTNEKQKLENQN